MKRRVRATTASFRAPASDFSPSISLLGFDRKNEEVRVRVRVRVRIHPRFVHTGRSRSIHSFVPTASSTPGAPPPRFVRAHPREHALWDVQSDGWRRGCGTDTNERGSIGLCETLEDGWIPIRAATAIAFGRYDDGGFATLVMTVDAS